MFLGDPEQHEIAGVVPVGLTELPERAADAVEAGGRHVHRAEAAVGSEVRRAALRRPPAGQRLALVAAGEEREATGATTACGAPPARRSEERRVGQNCGSKCIFRWHSIEDIKKKKKN